MNSTAPQVENCLVCQTVVGEIIPPGGLIFSDGLWQVDHAVPPIWMLGQLVIKSVRHCEQLAELLPEEAAALGPLIPRLSQALQTVTRAEKIHLASYGEGLRHVHFLVTPRTAEMPASNVRLTFWLLWRRSLYRFGWKKFAHPPTAAVEIARQVREALGAAVGS
jgi:diadenosine tetraphosphate (Ap4A) HIT family hydrolase